MHAGDDSRDHLIEAKRSEQSLTVPHSVTLRNGNVKCTMKRMNAGVIKVEYDVAGK
jgi:ribosomal protein S5